MPHPEFVGRAGSGILVKSNPREHIITSALKTHSHQKSILQESKAIEMQQITITVINLFDNLYHFEDSMFSFTCYIIVQHTHSAVYDVVSSML
jgi:hypothetical protein